MSEVTSIPNEDVRALVLRSAQEQGLHLLDLQVIQKIWVRSHSGRPAMAHWKTLHKQYVRWVAKCIWANIFHALAAAGGPPADVLTDSSAVKARRRASGGKRGICQAIGRSRG